MDDMMAEKIINEYCKDNMRKLKKVCDPIIWKKGFTTDRAECDDLYSLAMEVLRENAKRFDETRNCSFNTFITDRISKRFYDWTRDGRRAKRCNVLKDANGKIKRDEHNQPIIVCDESLDKINDDGLDSSERVSSGYSIEDSIISHEYTYDEKTEKFLSSLSKRQRKIADLIMQGYSEQEIRSELNISEQQYKKLFRDMKSFEKRIILKESHGNDVEEDKSMSNQYSQTAEKSKPMQYSISSINKKIEKRTIRFDHPLQRPSDQWTPSMKGNLISDILQGNPIPEIVFAEQIINGIPVVWDIDGKQRCTNCYTFSHDGFKVSRNVRRWNIGYVSQLKDENGEPLLDEEGFPQSEYKEFDIRGKKFSQLPDELQEKFLDYTFKCDQYLNCSSEDIAYHILRYNEGKSMNKSQKGIIRIGEEYASIIKSLSAMPFFKECGGYQAKDLNDGTIDRVVVESIMVSKYLDNWKSSPESMCDYLHNNATIDDFDELEDALTRLESVVTKEISDMFNSKNSFLWFGLFSRFAKTGEKDSRFADFMAELSHTLHSKEVNGTTYDELNEKHTATKDKAKVTLKMEVLETLMYEFLGVNKEEVTEVYVVEEVTHTETTEVIESTEHMEQVSAIEIIKECIKPDVIAEDIELYDMQINDISYVVDDIDAPILSDENRPALISLVAYAFDKEEDSKLEEWLDHYYRRNIELVEDQRENYLHMKEDFDNFFGIRSVA